MPPKVVQQLQLLAAPALYYSDVVTDVVFATKLAEAGDHPQFLLVSIMALLMAPGIKLLLGLALAVTAAACGIKEGADVSWREIRNLLLGGLHLDVFVHTYEQWRARDKGGWPADPKLDDAESKVAMALLGETLLEALPQAILQTYILLWMRLTGREILSTTDFAFQVLSIVLSLWSVSRALSTAMLWGYFFAEGGGSGDASSNKYDNVVVEGITVANLQNDVGVQAVQALWTLADAALKVAVIVMLTLALHGGGVALMYLGVRFVVLPTLLMVVVFLVVEINCCSAEAFGRNANGLKMAASAGVGAALFAFAAPARMVAGVDSGVPVLIIEVLELLWVLLAAGIAFSDNFLLTAEDLVVGNERFNTTADRVRGVCDGDKGPGAGCNGYSTGYVSALVCVMVVHLVLCLLLVARGRSGKFTSFAWSRPPNASWGRGTLPPPPASARRPAARRR